MQKSSFGIAKLKFKCRFSFLFISFFFSSTLLYLVLKRAESAPVAGEAVPLLEEGGVEAPGSPIREN